MKAAGHQRSVVSILLYRHLLTQSYLRELTVFPSLAELRDGLPRSWSASKCLYRHKMQCWTVCLAASLTKFHVKRFVTKKHFSSQESRKEEVKLFTRCIK